MMKKHLILLSLLSAISHNVWAQDSAQNEDPAPEGAANQAFKVQDYPGCDTAAILLKDCLPSYCANSSKLGRIYRKVSGLNKDGKCEYVERTDNLGGLDCAFEKEQLAEADIHFNKLYNFIFFTADALKEDEMKSLNGLKTKSCKRVADYVTKNGIPKTLNPFPLYDPALDISKIMPVIETISTQPKEPNILDKIVHTIENGKKDIEEMIKKNTESPEIKTAPDQLDKISFNTRSLMFTKEEIASLLGLNKSREPGGRTEVAISKSSISISANIFYFSSIIYYSNLDWTLWINNIKYSSRDVNHPAMLQEINSNFIKLNFREENIEVASPDWRNKLIAVSDNSFESISRNIIVDVISSDDTKTTANITVALKPNQTFDMVNMSIIEGR